MERRFSEDTKKDLQEQLFEMVKKSIEDEKGFDKKLVLKEMGVFVKEVVKVVFQQLEIQLANSISDNEDVRICYEYAERYVEEVVVDIKTNNRNCQLNRYMSECHNKNFTKIYVEYQGWFLGLIGKRKLFFQKNEENLTEKIDYINKSEATYWRIAAQYCKEYEEGKRNLLNGYCDYIRGKGFGHVDIWKSVMYWFLICDQDFIFHSLCRKKLAEKKKEKNSYYIQAIEKGAYRLFPEQKKIPVNFRHKYEELMKYMGFEVDGREDEYELPTGMTTDILVYLLQYRVHVKGRDENVQELTFFRVISSVIEEIKKYKESRKTSVKKLISGWKEQKQFSPQIYVEMGKKLKLGKFDEKFVTEILSRYDTIDEYTGYLVSLAIWRNLIENCEKYIPSMNDKRKVEIYDALSGSIAEIISLGKYFSGVELAMFADLLYGIVPVMMSADKNKDIAEVLNSLTKAIQYMRIDVVYDFYERCFEVTKKKEDIMKMYSVQNKLFCMRLENYVLQHGTIDESKIGSVSSKNSILFSQIQKSVLVARYFDKVQ